MGRTLQAFLDGRVDDDWAARVEAHLEHCRRCGMEARAYGELKDALRRCEVALRQDIADTLRTFAAQLASGDAPSR